jgi:hypothetical protein
MTKVDIFNMFVDKSNLDIRFKHPFIYEGYAYSTDRSAAIRCKQSEVDFEITNPTDIPKVSNVFKNQSDVSKISFKNLNFDKFKDFPETQCVGEDIYCSTCNGEGEVEWEFDRYTKEFDCPECNGSGYESNKRLVPTGKNTFGNYAVEINQAALDIKYLYNLHLISKFNNQPIIITKISDLNKQVNFRTGIFEIVIMPILISEYSVHKIIKSYQL